MASSSKLNFLVNPVFDGWSPDSTRLGGTERAVCEWAKRLQKMGHDIKVFHNGKHGEWDGVFYLDRSVYLDHAGDGFTVNIKDHSMPPQEPTILYTNEVDLTGVYLHDYKAVIAISNYAKYHTGIHHKNIEVLDHGYDADSYYPEKKVPKSVIYASSPDRGLNDLLRVWPDVIEIHPDATLITTYGADIGNVPNAICMGEPDDETVAELFRSSDIWCHPANGGELYCITGIQAQASGCWPVYYPIMALAETVKFGTKSEPYVLARDLIEAMNGHPEPPKLKFPDHDESTRQLLAIIAKYAPKH